MSAHSNVAPVIIKRKKVVSGDGHHGGAWKVAYADFVTAMMAFFLLMWLLNATTEKQRKGVADYFSPTVPINRISGGGDGNFGGDSVFSELTLPQNGTGASSLRPTEGRQARGEHGVSQLGEDGKSGDDTSGHDGGEEAFTAVEDALFGRGGESMVSDQAARHIITKVTDEGLVIELFDIEGVPLFTLGTHDPTKELRDIAEMLARIFDLVENNVAVGGYTRSQPIVIAKNPVWGLSSERANAMRELLEKSGLPSDRIQRVVGHADRSPVVKNPMAIRNNRLEVILLRDPS
ncbi:flagellar motor protein MotB [Rhodalgimonas zhirmunskyi]|uniref:OmpA family protein n=1 Tax=Rhodalgimonas zhirmunskyi TaxID=2964767 RepID=A0AAJ1U5G5_9RHOB|nr:flagellar motor protein MotB [Rhodoalgimonas zhirmunskyi]MDQ2093961.1 OmpA family protein [Rhodoalgimonas zhirmunskyi]